MLALAPGILWLAYHYRADSYRKGRFATVVRVFVWGCACTVPASFLEHILGASVGPGSLVRTLTVSYLLVAPIEEFFKLAAVWCGAYRHNDFQEPTDGLVFAATAAIGFATVENIIYLTHLGPAAILARIAFATPAHVLFAAMWGYSLGVARFQKDHEVWTISKGLLWAVLLHGSYNLLVVANPGAAMLSLIPLMIFMVWLMRSRIRRFQLHPPFERLGRGALVSCPACGAYTPEQDRTCARCGSSISPPGPEEARYCGQCRAMLNPKSLKCPRCKEPASENGSHIQPEAEPYRAKSRIRSFAHNW